jgi:hypothetical protein
VPTPSIQWPPLMSGGGGGKMFAAAASRAARARSGLSLGDDDAPGDFLPPSRNAFS